jgi:predicted nucleotidyltransferase
VPSSALIAAGFEHTGRHEHSDNWRAPGSGSLRQRTAVQFSAEDEGIAEAVARATIVDLAPGARLRVATVADLIVLKLAAAKEPKRRPSKRERDIADVLALLEEHPEVKSPELLSLLRSIRLQLISTDLDEK